MADPELTKQFESLGPELVRGRLKQMAPSAEIEAVQWLSAKDREARERAVAAEVAQTAFAREANDLAAASNAIALEANASAEAANALARSANETASRALAAAERQANAARTNTVIAAIAVLISIVSIFIALSHR